MDDSLSDALAELIAQINLRPKSSSAAAKVLFEKGGWAYLPVGEDISKLTIPICFMYGETDWVHKSGAECLI